MRSRDLLSLQPTLTRDCRHALKLIMSGNVPAVPAAASLQALLKATERVPLSGAGLFPLPPAAFPLSTAALPIPGEPGQAAELAET